MRPASNAICTCRGYFPGDCICGAEEESDPFAHPPTGHPTFGGASIGWKIVIVCVGAGILVVYTIQDLAHAVRHPFATAKRTFFRR